MKKIISFFMFTLLITACSKDSNTLYNDALTAEKNKDYIKSVELLDKSCSKNHLEACMKLADIYNIGKNVDKNIEKANTLYKQTIIIAEKECNANNEKACSILYNIYDKGLGVDKNIEKSDFYADKSCSLGNNSLCYYLARVNSEDIEKFTNYMTKGCEFNNSSACYALGNMYISGFNESILPVTKDTEKGINLLEKACSLSKSMCENLGNIYMAGLDVAQDYEKADKYFKMALDYYTPNCDKGDSIACSFKKAIEDKVQ